MSQAEEHFRFGRSIIIKGEYMLEIALNGDNGYRSNIVMSKVGLKRFTPVIPKVISITHLFSEERLKVEKFIEDQFSKSYDASITQHYPMLMSVQDGDGNILAALGFRPAQNGALFLEQYLDGSVESVLSDHFDHAICRKDIIEIGSLASTTSGASIFLFIALNAWLEQQGYKMATITATHRLKRFFSMLKLDFVQLDQADPDRLPDHGKNWGNYYETRPRILAGSISQTQSRMNIMLKFHLADDEQQMSAHLYTLPAGTSADE
jgi:hypothetical protein